MSTSSRDEVRRFALLKAELLAAARAAVEKLTDDQCEAIDVEIEQRLTGAERETAPAAPLIEEQVGRATEESRPMDLPIAVVKRRAAEDIERDYLADLMKHSDGSITVAVRLADEDRTNFRRRLQRAGLRARGQMKPGPKYTDQILTILDDHRIGLRTYEIANGPARRSPTRSEF